MFLTQHLECGIHTYCTSVRAAAGINYTSIRLDSSHFCLKMSALDNLQEILGKAVRVVLVDGRVIEGSLSCMDKDLNFIIADACEYHGVTDSK